MTEKKILMYLHCKKCLFESGLKEGSGFGKEKLVVGWTRKGLQLWCEGCDKNIIALDFKIQKVSIE